MEVHDDVARDGGIRGQVTQCGESGRVGEFLYEPDGAVIRAGLVGTAARMLGGRLLDPTIAYLTTDSIARQDPDLATGYRIIDILPFKTKVLKQYLRERNIGRVTIKKRGTDVTPEVLRPQLGLKGENEATVVLTRITGKHAALIVEPLTKQSLT